MKIVPFTFDSAFDGGASEAKAKAEAQFREELNAARTAAHAQGYEEGYAQAKQELEAATLACLQTLASRIGAVVADVERVKRELVAEAAGLIVPMAEAMAGLEIQRRPHELLDRFVQQVFEEHSLEPRLVIRVADSQLDAVKSRIESLAATYGFQGRLIFLAEATLQPGDCLIEWPDGGIEVRAEHRLAQVREKAEAFIAALEQGAAAPHGSSGSEGTA
ncbi:FliH/SctL family protein [Pedomonas sp. V897]|uniref:FliH/SctL family protein n=1 Tax=Pedomonas sp. V897 TaxID=3446482 RepID=UPI003EDF0694